MNSRLLLLTMFLCFSQAFAGEPNDDLWHKLKQDFNSKPYFFNDAINDQRNGVVSPFIQAAQGQYATSNALPLTAKQIKNIPEARFVDKKIFTLAMVGRERLIKAGKIKDLPIVAIVDFSKNSRLRRFYIFDIDKGEVLINTWTSHAYNSDKDHDGYAETFSNVPGSSTSSVGFMVSDVTYTGTYGFSQRVRGLDPVLNSNMLARAVVIHGFGGLGPLQAAYGSLSTSEGCFMFSANESGRFWGMEDKPMLELVIKTLKTGAMIFTYTDEVDAAGKPIILKSQWLKATDIPKEEEEEIEEAEATTPETKPEVKLRPVLAPVILNNDLNPDKEVVSHSGTPEILDARQF